MSKRYLVRLVLLEVMERDEGKFDQMENRLVLDKVVPVAIGRQVTSEQLEADLTIGWIPCPGLTFGELDQDEFIEACLNDRLEGG